MALVSPATVPSLAAMQWASVNTLTIIQKRSLVNWAVQGYLVEGRQGVGQVTGRGFLPQPLYPGRELFATRSWQSRTPSMASVLKESAPQ